MRQKQKSKTNSKVTQGKVLRLLENGNPNSNKKEFTELRYCGLDDKKFDDKKKKEKKKKKRISLWQSFSEYPEKKEKRKYEICRMSDKKRNKFSIRTRI